jgi:hypothetical protein
VPKGELLGDLPYKQVKRPEGQAPAARTRPATGFVGKVFDWDTFESVKNDPDAKIPTPDGSVFIGDKGAITTGTYGEQTRLLPVEKMRDYKFPAEYLTRSPGHYHDWIRACKGGDAASSNFNVASPFVEWMLLGAIALRVEGKIEWDPAKMRITNNAQANKYLKPSFRKGWSLA